MHRQKLGALAIAGLVVGIVLAGAPARAHHSFAAEFDINKPVTLQGVVTKVEWVNPHVYIYLDVKDASGKVTPWSLSSLGPAGIRRAGITRASLGQGQQVTVLAYHAKDGSNFGFMRRMTFADGHTVELWLGDDEARK
jgi:Family of unknown function (DUF6152)